MIGMLRTDPFPTETQLVILAATATILVMVLYLPFLTRYPPLFIDESWNANTAWNWLQTGTNFDTIHAGTLDQYGYAWMRWPFLGNAPWLASFAIFGLGLFQARLVSWVFGVSLLLATVAAGRRNYSAITGALGALLLCVSSPFLQASHYVRPDSMLASNVMLAFFVALVALEKDHWWAHMLAGLLIGLSANIHFNGLMFALALVAMYLVAYRSKMLRKRGTWLCAVGGLLGILSYVAIHILPNPPAYLAIHSLPMASSHIPPLRSLSLTALLDSVRREVGRYHFYDFSLDFALIGASIAYLTVRRSKADRLLLAYVGAAFIGFVLFVGNKHEYYAILFYPFLLLMVAETLVSLFRAGKGVLPQRAFAMGLAGLMLVSSAFHLARPIAQHRDYDYYSVTDKIRTVIPKGARVMAPPEWWLGLADYDYRSSLNLTFYHFQNGYSLTEGLEADRPDVLIVDTRWRSLLVDEGYYPQGQGFGMYKLPRSEFADFLNRRGEKLLEFTDPWHGRFEIYAVHWD
jgi:4-amino-4-deoxy-L-arabinose transferase-like glycosyltransferase